VNDPPVAQDQAIVLDEDTVFSGELAATDVDSSVVTYAVALQPDHGTVTVDGASGAFTYQPAQDYNGPDRLTFVASDGQASSATATGTVSITVNPVNDPPVALDQAITLDEDTVFSGQFVATDVDGPELTYALAVQPSHGAVTLDAASGAFIYQPAQDYNGADRFTFVASDGQASSSAATVSITVNPVNDPPALPFIPDQTNSAETRQTFIALPPREVDGGVLRYSVLVSDSAIADAEVDDTATLSLTPKAPGTARVTVQAPDGLLQATTSFQFTVGDVTKSRSFGVPAPQEQVVAITNTSDHDVAFELTHNGNLLATTGEQLVQEVRGLPDDVPGELFERKLWRYVRDRTYHYDPLTASNWQHDPLLFLNSVGFGYCEDVTAVLASLARRAGYTARAWALNGYIVPEVRLDGR
jgi:Big-like domain-containing protein/putative type II/III system pilus formation protein/transglutaminase superfamily protein